MGRSLSSTKAARRPGVGAILLILLACTVCTPSASAYQESTYDPDVFGVRDGRWLQNAWGMQHAIVSAGIHATIAMVAATNAVLRGEMYPTASYTASPVISAQTRAHFLMVLHGPGAQAAGQGDATQYLNARHEDYLADTRASGERPNDVVTACAYFASTTLAMEHDGRLSAAVRPAVRGACVLELAQRQAGLRQMSSDDTRQSVAELMSISTAISADQYRRGSAAQRAQLKAGMEQRFQEVFGSLPQQVPLDHLACAGATSPDAVNNCQQITNDRLAAIANHTR